MVHMCVCVCDANLVELFLDWSTRLCTALKCEQFISYHHSEKGFPFS